MIAYCAIVALLGSFVIAVNGLASSSAVYGSQAHAAAQKSLRQEASALWLGSNSTSTSTRLLSVVAAAPGMTAAMRTMMGLDMDELNYVGGAMSKAECRPKYGRLRYFKEAEKRNPPML